VSAASKKNQSMPVPPLIVSTPVPAVPVHLPSH
jgi:hypothetical protein